MTDATSARCIAVGSMDAIDEVVEMKWTSTADASTDESASTQELDIERNESQEIKLDKGKEGRRRGRGRAAQKPVDDSDVVLQRRRYILLALSVIPLLAATIALAAALKGGTATSSNIYATTDKIVTAPKQQESDAPTHAPSVLAQEVIAASTDRPSQHPTSIPTTSQTASPVNKATLNMSFLSIGSTNSPTLSNVPTSQPTELCVQIGQSCPKGGKDSLQCCNNGICVKNKDTGETVCAEDSKQSSGNKQQQQQQANTCTDSGAECPKNPKECCSGKCSFVITTMKQEGGGEKQQGVGGNQGGGEKQQSATQICE